MTAIDLDALRHQVENTPPGETCQDCNRADAVSLCIPEKYAWCNYSPDSMSLSELVARCAECRQKNIDRREAMARFRWM